MAGAEHPKSALTAWERWELASFDAATDASRAKPQPADEEALRRAREEAERDGRQAGHAEGYAAGLAQGLAEGRAQAEAAGREEALRLAGTLASLEAGIAGLERAVADDLLALGLEISRQMVRQTVAAKPEVVLGVIREALEQLPLLHAAIRLNPEDASLVRLRAGDQLTHAGHRLHEDPKLRRGDVVIEAGGSHIDASLATRWRRIVDALGQDAPWLDTEGK